MTEMTTREEIIAVAKEAGLQTYLTRDCHWTGLGKFYAIAHEAGAASRDAEIAELKDALGYDWDKYKASQMALRECMQMVVGQDAEIAELVGVLGDVTAHLVAAHSLLSRGGKKAAASDTIFKIMLQDYEKSFEAGRKWLRQRLEE